MMQWVLANLTLSCGPDRDNIIQGCQIPHWKMVCTRRVGCEKRTEGIEVYGSHCHLKLGAVVDHIFQTEVCAGLTTWVCVPKFCLRNWTWPHLLNRPPWHTLWVQPGSSMPGIISDLQILQISLNANLISQSGGPCVCTQSDLCVSDAAYNLCIIQVRNDLTVATAAISSISSLLMGFLANLPVGLAPGLGINAYVRVRIRVKHGD